MARVKVQNDALKRVVNGPADEMQIEHVALGKERLHRLAVQLEDALGIRQIRLPALGQADARAPVLEERTAQLVFQRLNVLADGRLGQIHPARGFRKAAIAANGDEGFELTELHGGFPSLPLIRISYYSAESGIKQAVLLCYTIYKGTKAIRKLRGVLVVSRPACPAGVGNGGGESALSLPPDAAPSLERDKRRGRPFRMREGFRSPEIEKRE